MMKEDKIQFEDLEGGALKIDYEYQGNIVHVIFNPSKHTFMYDFPNYVKLTFNNSGLIKQFDEGVFIHMAIINGLSVSAYLEKRDETKIK